MTSVFAVRVTMNTSSGRARNAKGMRSKYAELYSKADASIIFYSGHSEDVSFEFQDHGQFRDVYFGAQNPTLNA